MTIELGTITLDHLTEVTLREKARIVQHDVPGLTGSLSQVMGRPSVDVSFSGIFYGESAADALKQLRTAYLKGDPVDFFADAKGEGYFAQVIITGLDVRQRAGFLDEFEYHCHVTEYVKPPSATAVSATAAVNTQMKMEAAAFMDNVQGSMAQVQALSGALANFQNPVEPMTQMPAQFSGALGDSTQQMSEFKKLLVGE
jgi:hypothetical protein